MASHPDKITSCPSTPEPPLKRLLRAVQRHWLLSAGPLFSLATPRTAPGRSMPTPLNADKRSQPRVHLQNTSVQVTDGCLCATAQIDNISPSGICLCNLPDQLYRSAGQLTVFSSDNPVLPVLHIEPRWEQKGRSGKSIGAAILNASETWRLFFIHAASRAKV